jgi:hypothetical protein
MGGRAGVGSHLEEREIRLAEAFEHELDLEEKSIRTELGAPSERRGNETISQRKVAVEASSCSSPPEDRVSGLQHSIVHDVVGRAQRLDQLLQKRLKRQLSSAFPRQVSA